MSNRKTLGCGCLVVFVILLVLVGGGVYAYITFQNEIQGANSTGEDVEFVVEQGTSPTGIANKLEEEGIIGSAFIFEQYTSIMGGSDQFQYGRFDLNNSMSYDELILALSTPNMEREQVSVTFPEGISSLRFAELMQEAGLCTVEEFLDVANNGDFSQFDFWNEIPEVPNRFMKSEGYLYPETYFFFADSTVYEMVEKIYAQFDLIFTDEMKARADELGMSVYEVITLTSIVQREAGPIEHQADVAAVLHNRLAPDTIEPKLQCNVSGYVNRAGDNNYLYDTVAYYLGGGDSDAGWALFQPGQEYETLYNSYNTYDLEGLPAGPICNPGYDAINNTLYPTEDSPYYFFVTDLAGTYYYAETADEHSANDAAAQVVNATFDE